MSTSDEVGRSQVRSVWSHEVEYATVESLEANVTADTGALCDFNNTIGPTCGVAFSVVEAVIFRLLLARDADFEGTSDSAAGGALDGSVVQIPTVRSAEAERMRLDGRCTQISSTLARWPYNSR